MVSQRMNYHMESGQNAPGTSGRQGRRETPSPVFSDKSSALPDYSSSDPGSSPSYSPGYNYDALNQDILGSYNDFGKGQQHFQQDFRNGGSSQMFNNNPEGKIPWSTENSSRPNLQQNFQQPYYPQNLTHQQLKELQELQVEEELRNLRGKEEEMRRLRRGLEEKKGLIEAENQHHLQRLEARHQETMAQFHPDLHRFRK